MPQKNVEIITQEQLRIGVKLMENTSMATRAWQTYVQELARRVALGAVIETGPLTFDRGSMYVGSVC